MPLHPHRIDGLSRAARRTIRTAARRVMRDGGTWPTARLWWPVAVDLGADAPTRDVLDAVLAEDPLLWCLPDGDWLHVGAATWGRTFTTRPVPAAQDVGVLRTVPDLSAAICTFRGWDRVPVRSRLLRGFAELVEDGACGPRLVLPPGLCGGGRSLLGMSPGPEGLRVLGVEDDPVASECLRMRLQVDGARRQRNTPTAEGQGLPWTPVAVPTTRPWTVLDVELAVLVRDHTLRRSATVPVREILDGQVLPLADTA